MNESGKSNLIEALSKIDLVNGITEDVSVYRNRINIKPIEISVLLKGTDGDSEEIVGSGQTRIILGENGRYEISGAAAECFASKIASYDLSAAMKTGKYDNANERNSVIKEVDGLKEYSNIPLEKTRQRIKRARTLINIHIKDEERKKEALDYIESITTHFDCLLGGIPCLFFHKSNKSLKNSYSLAEVKPYSNDNKGSIDVQQDDLLLSLLKTSGLNRDELIRAMASNNPAEKETYETRTNRILENKIMRGFREYYKQGTENIILVFRIEGNRLNLHMRSGDATTKFSERSNGLRWYLEMYIDMLAQIDHSRPVVYLLDEPGIYLHINAQNELRNMFVNHARAGTQIIYSTHSPYMIDENFACIRGIIKTENEEFSCILNSLYNSEFHQMKCLDTLSPIAAAMGMNMALVPGVSKEQLNIIVEGVTDQIYLNAMAKHLALNGENFRIIPSTGADNSQHLASIMLGWGYRFIVLYDYDNKGKSCAKAIVKDLNLEFGCSVYMLKEVSVEEFAYLNSIPQDQSIVIENLLAETDRVQIGITDTDTKEQKRLAAMRFSTAINEGWKPSIETCKAFTELFARINVQ